MTLREARFRQQMTQYDLWRLTGITAPRISLVERGFARLKQREREAVAKALEVPIESIDFDQPAPPRRKVSAMESQSNGPLQTGSGS